MKRFKKYIFIIALIVIGIFLYIYGFTFAKYVSESIWDYHLKSNGFYFSSDYLDSNNVKNVNNLWDGESVQFNIKNNMNQTLITNYDINYNASCKVIGEAFSYTKCIINDTNSNSQSGVLSSFQTCINTKNDEVDVSTYNKTNCELEGYNWESQIAIKELYFDVVLTNNDYKITDVTVNVSVTSTSPYQKTISGDFILHKKTTNEDNITLDYKNYSNYNRLIVSNSYSDLKCVKITWNADKLLIDADKSEFSSYKTDSFDYINEIKFNIDAKDSLSYIFYNRNLGTIYDATEFLIEEEDGCE